MTFRHLEAFVQVATQGGFTRAAEKLCLTQPTVSGQIKELEQELGVVLFHRLPRLVQLTEAGELFLPKAKELLDARGRVLEWVASYRGLLWGRLTVYASTIPGEYLLPSELARFKKEHPEIQISLQVQDSEQVLHAVRTGEAAIGIVGKRDEDDSLQFEPLWSDQISLYAAPGVCVEGIVEAEQLLKLPIVFREEGSGTREAALAALANIGVSSGELTTVAEFGSNAALKQAVMAGVGVGFLSEESVRCEVECRRLEKVQIRGFDSIRRCFYAVWFPGRSLSPVSDAFLQQLLQRGNNKNS